jgi:hypothetical protein
MYCMLHNHQQPLMGVAILYSTYVFGEEGAKKRNGVNANSFHLFGWRHTSRTLSCGLMMDCQFHLSMYLN